MGDNIRNNWTKEELDFMKQNYSIMSDKELSEHFGTHTTAAVGNKRKKMGWKRPRYRRYTFDDVIKAFQDKEYILLSDENDFKDACSKLKYLCSKHKDKGVQQISMGHLVGCDEGCYYCGREKTEQAHRDMVSEEDRIKLCESKGFIYKGYNYDNHLLNILFICPKHKDVGLQSMRYANMKRDIKGCRYCVEKKAIVKSKGEIEIEGILNNNNIRFIRQYVFNDCKNINLLPFDFYLLDYNICIEFDGEQHYYPVRFNGMSQEKAEENFKNVQFRDKIKTEYCVDNDIPLIRIPYTYRGKIFPFLQKELEEYNLIINN